MIGARPAASLDPMALTDRDRAILNFERSWWTEAGPKDTAIRERFELSGTRYWRGELHLVAIYSRALTAAEARQNFLAGAN